MYTVSKAKAQMGEYPHTHTHTHLQISLPHHESCNAGDVNTQSIETQSDVHPPGLQRAIASIFLGTCAQPGSTRPWVHPPTPTPKPRACAPRGLAPADQLGMKRQTSRLQKASAPRRSGTRSEANTPDSIFPTHLSKVVLMAQNARSPVCRGKVLSKHEGQSSLN